MQASVRALLEVLHLDVLTIMILFGVGLLLFACFLDELIQFFDQPPVPPFRFLDLPPEVRNIVYGYLSDRYWITWGQFVRRQVTRRQKRAIRADAFFYLNKQIYEEATHVLVSRKPDVFCTDLYPRVRRCHPSPESHLENASWAIGRLQKGWNILRRLRTIKLNIFWVNYDWLEWSEQGQKDSRWVRELKKDIEMMCVFGFAKMPELRTIKICFRGARKDSRQWIPLSPAKHRIPSLLRPLKAVRREIPGVVVEMPEDCPISTAELAKQQEDCPWFVDLQERLEDNYEKLENLKASMEGRMMKDGEFLL